MSHGTQGKKGSAIGRMLRAGAVVSLVISSLAGVHASAADATITSVGSVNQVYVTGLAPDAQASLISPDGSTFATQDATSLGGILFRDVPAGEGYRVHLDADNTELAPVVVHDDSPAPWDPSIYDQSLPVSGGYGYLTTRDGTKLAYTIHVPTSPAGQPGLPYGTQLPNGPDYLPPYPTLVEYSGYGYANPAGPDSGIAILANLMGFAVVDVSMRGTGCSSGAYDFFEPLQNLDGYDVVETVARQPWVRDHKVGMIGISYGGISQLFTAQLNPPSLEAIAPLSVIDTTATTLYPGGDLNDGFAVAWSKEREAQGQPAGQGRHGTQGYAETQIANGDATCLANQALHDEEANLEQKIADNSHYVPSVADPLDPITFVHKIHVPTFMACQFEDEQTGGHCPALVSHFTGTDKKWFTFTNGAHIDSLDPETYNRWYDFLEIYVAHQAPLFNSVVENAAAPLVVNGAFGTPQEDVSLYPLDPIQLIPSYTLAKHAFEKLQMVRVLFDNGAGANPTGTQTAGDPYPGFERSYSTWPIAGTSAQTWYVGPGGTLSDDLPATAGVDQYTSDANALPLNNYGPYAETGGMWGNAPQWDWRWNQNPAGTAVSYMTAPLTTDTAVVGAGGVYVWVKSSTPDVDLLATISEVRPDGNETFVQNGFMRGSVRALSTDSNNLFKEPSTLLNPIPSYLASDVSPMPSDQYVRVAIPLYYEGHMYRAGSKIRVTIAGPNGTQAVWSFGHSQPEGTTANVSILSSPTQPSKLVLPVVPGLPAPTALPPCPGLRNEPCRPYQAIVNG